MNSIVRYGWYFLLAAIAGEIMVPFILAPFYKGYRHSIMAISSLGSIKSPVRLLFNLWMLIAGILFLLSTPSIYYAYQDVSKPLSLACILFLAVFAIGACIFTCFFSVNETKDVVTTASKIHGAGSAIGFILLLFVPLFIAILSLKVANRLVGSIAAISFILALVCFVLFVMADKPKFHNSLITREGLWQRLSLLFMYVPLVWVAIQNIALK